MNELALFAGAGGGILGGIGAKAQLKPKLRITYKRGRWWCGYPGMAYLWLASGSTPKEAYVLWGQSQFWKGRA